MRTVRRCIIGRKSTLLYEVSRQLAGVPPPPTTEDRELRARLLKLDGRCEYCEQRPATTVDHYWPLIRLERPTPYCNDLWNSVPCCKDCNCSKGGRLCHEWMGSGCRGDPLASAPEPRRLHLRAKLAAYDVVFRVRAARRDVDALWWEGVQRRVTRFLTQLQAEVDTRRTVPGVQTRGAKRRRRVDA